MKKLLIALQERLSLILLSLSDRNALRNKIQDLEKERDLLATQLSDQWNGRQADRILHHSPRRIAGNVAEITTSIDTDDHNLVSRVIAAYRKSVRTPTGPTNSMWLTEFASTNRETHKLLDNGDHASIANVLRNPATSMLFYGFESIQAADVPKNSSSIWRAWQHQITYDSLLQIARAIGARRVENPEAGVDFDEAPGIEALLEQLDTALGFKIEFPNIFAGEIGLVTSRGIANYRAIQALYQAWRIKQIVADIPKPRILEIGAGLGRTAYFAMQMGVSSYTIIDIPLTGVAQGYFLGRLLGENAVSLWDERPTEASVHILPPVAFHQRDTKFDLIVNVDSITEMSESTAREYFDATSTRSSRFLSINHEHNAFTVAQIYQGRDDVRVWRTPCWSRRGYVEELIHFTEKASHNVVAR